MRANFASWAERYGTAVAGVVVLLGCALAAPTFTEGQNLLNVGKDAAYLAILSVGFAMALLVAELDLSVADVASLVAVCTGFLVQQGQPPLVCAGAGLLVGVLAGLVNGAAVTVLRVPSLIATLGTAAIAKGLSFGLTGGVAFVGRWPRGFTGLSRGSVAGVPALLLWTAGVGLLAWWLAKRTRTGARMTATGEAEEAARLAGVPTAGMKRLGLGLAGGCAGLAGVLLVASLSSAAPNMAGDLFLYAIAAVLLGMTMFEPGRPNVPGTLFSVLVLKALGNALVLAGAQYWVQDVVLGVVIIGSVAASSGLLRQAAFKTA